MSIPSTPSNLYVQSGNGKVYLSWDQTSGANAYRIQSSQDNVNFSTLATILTVSSVLNNYYLWSGGTEGTQYWFQIAASSDGGTTFSAYTLSQPAIVTAIGVESLGSLRTQAQQRSDFVNNTFITVPEWNSYISQSYKELYDLLIQKFGDDYYLANTYTWTTDGSSVLYPLPVDFYKSLLIEVALNPKDPNSWITLRKFMRVQQNLYNYPNVYTFYGITNLRYRIDGNFLHLIPIAQNGQTVRMWYAPRPNALLADTDVIDGVSGWEEYIVIDACIKAKAKQEDDVQVFMAQKSAMLKRIEDAAENRDIGDPEVVSDSRTRNFGWTDGSGGEGQGWW